MSEDASANTVVHVVQAYDPDGDDVTYSFVGTCAGRRVGRRRRGLEGGLTRGAVENAGLWWWIG